MIKNWAIKLSIPFFVLFVLSGCTGLSSSLSRPDELQAQAAGYQLPKLPENGKAIVYVVRPSIDCATHSFSVYIDQQKPESEMGSMKGRQYIYFDVAPGEHKIISKVDYWNTMAEMTVSVKAGDILFIELEPDMGFLTLENRILKLQDYQGKSYVKMLTRGKFSSNNQQTALTTAVLQRQDIPAKGDIFVGTIKGGNYAKGVGFSNINIKLEVVSATGETTIYYVRSDSKIIDSSGKYLDYREAGRGKGKRVEIEYFTITDATGGDPSRSDFAFEIGQKGVRLLRFLD